MASGTAVWRMDLASSNKRGAGSGMASNTVCGCRCCGNVLLDLGAMVMVMACEIAVMTLNAGATITTVDRGVTVTIAACDSGAVDIGVAEKAAVVVH